MKKVILALSIFLLAGISFNSKSYAEGCEEVLPNLLRACFLANQIGTLSVTVVGSTCTIGGTVISGKLEAANLCVKDYETAAASCPGAPTLLFTAVVTDGSPRPTRKGVS